MKNILHKIYEILGSLLCNCLLCFWNLRDRIYPINTDAVLFVTHPDDDTLFFHSFIKEYKPYICLMTTGWSLRRMPCFFKAMKYYGIQRFRAYPLKTKDNPSDVLEGIVTKMLHLHSFKTVVTHNETGEYGHEEHIRVSHAVKNVVKKTGNNILLLNPVSQSLIEQFPLSQDIIQEKSWIFNNIYVTESWVLIENLLWVEHEQLRKVECSTEI